MQLKEQLAVQAVVAGIEEFECDVICCCVEEMGEGLRTVKVDGEGRRKARREREEKREWRERRMEGRGAGEKTGMMAGCDGFDLPGRRDGTGIQAIDPQAAANIAVASTCTYDLPHAARGVKRGPGGGPAGPGGAQQAAGNSERWEGSSSRVGRTRSGVCEPNAGRGSACQPARASVERGAGSSAGPCPLPPCEPAAACVRNGGADGGASGHPPAVDLLVVTAVSKLCDLHGSGTKGGVSRLDVFLSVSESPAHPHDAPFSFPQLKGALKVPPNAPCCSGLLRVGGGRGSLSVGQSVLRTHTRDTFGPVALVFLHPANDEVDWWC